MTPKEDRYLHLPQMSMSQGGDIDSKPIEESSILSMLAMEVKLIR